MAEGPPRWLKRAWNWVQRNIYWVVVPIGVVIAIIFLLR